MAQQPCTSIPAKNPKIGEIALGLTAESRVTVLLKSKKNNCVSTFGIDFPEGQEKDSFF